MELRLLLGIARGSDYAHGVYDAGRIVALVFGPDRVSRGRMIDVTSYTGARIHSRAMVADSFGDPLATSGCSIFSTFGYAMAEGQALRVPVRGAVDPIRLTVCANATLSVLTSIYAALPALRADPSRGVTMHMKYSYLQQTILSIDGIDSADAYNMAMGIAVLYGALLQSYVLHDSPAIQTDADMAAIALDIGQRLDPVVSHRLSQMMVNIIDTDLYPLSHVPAGVKVLCNIPVLLDRMATTMVAAVARDPAHDDRCRQIRTAMCADGQLFDALLGAISCCNPDGFYNILEPSLLIPYAYHNLFVRVQGLSADHNFAAYHPHVGDANVDPMHSVEKHYHAHVVVMCAICHIAACYLLHQCGYPCRSPDENIGYRLYNNHGVFWDPNPEALSAVFWQQEGAA